MYFSVIYPGKLIVVIAWATKYVSTLRNYTIATCVDLRLVCACHFMSHAIGKVWKRLNKNGKIKELIVEDEIEFLQRVPCKERLRPLKKLEECCRNEN
jgi:hypothetical protein